MDRILGILFLSLFSIIARPQQNVLSSVDASQTMAAIYDYDVQAFNSSITQVSDPVIEAYLREYNALLIYTASNTPENYKKYVAMSDKALDLAGSHKYGATLTSNLQMHRSLVELSTGSLVGGGIQFWKSYRSFKKGEERYSDYDGQLMLRGVFDVLLSQIPEKWKSLAGLFGFGSGNLQKGFSEIDLYYKKVQHVKGLREEALLLTFANIFLSHDQRVTDAQRSLLRNSQTPVIIYAYLLSNGRNCMGSEADFILDNLPPSVLDKFPLIIHQKAKFALRRLDSDSAIKYADEFLTKYKGSSCRNDAPLLKAYALLLQGKRTEAITQANVAASMEFSSDVDKRTNADARIFHTMNQVLVKARFQFEYGNFSESLATLNSFKPKSEDMIEFYFRLARAEDKLGKSSEAIVHYDKAIALAANNKRYFGPYSAVYAADLSLRSGDKISAKKYIDKARVLNNGEFSKEIDQRISLTLRAIDGDK